MKQFLRRLRGIIGTGLTWAVGWAGTVVGVYLLFGGSLQFIGMAAFIGSTWGFIAGVGFAVILSIVERRHILADLSLWRVALWGGIGGTLLFLVTVLILSLVGSPQGGVLIWVVMNILVGAGFASGSVALAKRSDTKLIEGGEPLAALEGE